MNARNIVAIRPLCLDDAAFLCSIFKDNAEYYEIFFDSENAISEWEDRIIKILNQDIVKHFIIETNNKPVGWISFSDYSSDERELCVLVRNHQDLHRGYGAQSLSWFIEKSKSDKMQSLLLNVNQNNSRAIHFYQCFGFKIFAEEIIPECNEAVNLAQYKMRLLLR